MFQEQYVKFIQEFGESKKMVLSTSLNDVVTSRMMSIILINEKLYFQTDKNFRKYNQLKNNSNVSLCADNIQILGKCLEVGKPVENTDFCAAYKNFFPSSYSNYSLLEDERLFAVTMTSIERWLYIDRIPWMEVFDIENEKYELKKYFAI